MEYIVHNTDIFDEKIDEKFGTIIINNRGAFTKEKSYVLKVSFHVNLLNDKRFEEFIVPTLSKTKKYTKMDKICDVMNFQLSRLEQVLIDKDIEVYSATIQGDQIESENIIKVDISETILEGKFKGKSKNKNIIKISSIIPNLPSTKENITKLASKRLSEIFYDFMDIFKDKKLLSEILEIEETEDDELLFRAFNNQYGELWLSTKKIEEELMEHLKDRSLDVSKNYMAKKDTE